MNYYVYYKVAPAQLEATRAQVDELFKEVKHEFHLQGRWMRRADDPSTYMEVYEGVRDSAAFEAFLQKRAVLPGTGRRTERFVLTSGL